jgi:hypothetical protein
MGAPYHVATSVRRQCRLNFRISMLASLSCLTRRAPGRASEQTAACDQAGTYTVYRALLRFRLRAAGLSRLGLSVAGLTRSGPDLTGHLAATPSHG